MENTNNNIKFRYELSRKVIHIAYSSTGFIYLFFGREIILILLIIAVTLMVALDIGRAYSENIQKFYHSIFEKILRQHELDNRKSLFTGKRAIRFKKLILKKQEEFDYEVLTWRQS